MKEDRTLCPHCLKSPYLHPCPSEMGKKSGASRRGDSDWGKKLVELREKKRKARK